MLGELLVPATYLRSIAEAGRVVAVPMGLAACFLAVVAEQQDGACAALSRERDACRARIAISIEVGWRQLDGLESAMQRVGAVSGPGEYAIDLCDVHLPPLPIHSEQRVSPWGGLVSGVGDDHASFFGRPRRFAPGSDELNVVCGEAWAAGKADDGAVVPAASIGRFMASLVSSKTATPCSNKCAANNGETSTGTSRGNRPRSAVMTGFLEVTTICVMALSVLLQTKRAHQGGLFPQGFITLKR